MQLRSETIRKAKRFAQPASNRKRKRVLADEEDTETTRSRGSINDEYRYPTPPLRKRFRLTAHNLKLHDIDMGSRKRSSTGISNGSRTTSSSSVVFGQQLLKNDVEYRYSYAKPPGDIAKVREYFDRSRESPQPTQEEFERYREIASKKQNEATCKSTLYSTLAKTPKAPGYNQYSEHIFNNVCNELTRELPHAKPDFFEAYTSEHLPQEAKETLEGEVQPSDYDFMMPAFAVEIKNTGAGLQTAEIQAGYDGALMTHSSVAQSAYALTYLHPANLTSPYGETQAITATFNGIELNIYANYGTDIETSGDSRNFEPHVVYSQHRVIRDDVIQDYNTFRDACKHLRNAQEFGESLARKRKELLQAFVEDNAAYHTPSQSSNHSNRTGKGRRGAKSRKT